MGVVSMLGVPCGSRAAGPARRAASWTTKATMVTYLALAFGIL